VEYEVLAQRAADVAAHAHGPSLAARAWHTARRSVGFSYYGFLALGVGFVAAPAQRAIGRLAGRSDDPDVGAQRLVHRASRSFVRVMERLGQGRVRWHGAERLRRGPLLIVANHPSLIDTPLLSAQMPQADFLVSAEWSGNPFLRRAIAAAGYLCVDRGAAAVVREAVHRLRAGRCVVVFPEGSRTPPEGLRPFQRGAAHIALAAGCDVVPIVIQVAPRTLMKGQSWAHMPDHTPEWRIDVGEPIPTGEIAAGSRRLAAQRLTGILQRYFEERWERGTG
jgi:1-acyl-sn-glycerol-3-phosphate acyltransferase